MLFVTNTVLTEDKQETVVNVICYVTYVKITRIPGSAEVMRN